MVLTRNCVACSMAQRTCALPPKVGFVRLIWVDSTCVAVYGRPVVNYTVVMMEEGRVVCLVTTIVNMNHL